jgi:hypothetical protein
VKLTATIPLFQRMMAAPMVKGPNTIEVDMDFVALNDGTNPVLTLDLRNTETS